MATTPEFGAAGTEFWSEMTGKYQFDPHELTILESAARTVDLIARLNGTLDAEDVMIVGSMGQQVLHPAAAEVRQQRTTLAGLIKKLNVPDEQGESPRSVGARKAASARWSKTG